MLNNWLCCCNVHVWQLWISFSVLHIVCSVSGSFFGTQIPFLPALHLSSWGKPLGLCMLRTMTVSLKGHNCMVVFTFTLLFSRNNHLTNRVLCTYFESLVFLNRLILHHGKSWNINEDRQDKEKRCIVSVQWNNKVSIAAVCIQVKHSWDNFTWWYLGMSQAEPHQWSNKVLWYNETWIFPES